MGNKQSSSIVGGHEHIVSCSLPCNDVSFDSFLLHARGQPRFYWEHSNEQIALAGMGSVFEFSARGRERFRFIEQQLRDLFADIVILNEDENLLLAPRVFGGFSFCDDLAPDPTWTVFGPARFILPHYQLIRIDGQQWLTIAIRLPFGENPANAYCDLCKALENRIALLRELTHEPRTCTTQAPLVDLCYPMSYTTWEANVLSALQQMQDGGLTKVVLTRCCEAHFAAPVNVDIALSYLANQYASCYRFLFEMQASQAFYGASPELLASLDGNDFKTMALAGSIQRGKTSEEDATYQHMLLTDPKERREHQFVLDAIVMDLQTHAEHIVAHDTEVLTLSNIQHLQTRITARLHPQRHILNMVEHLHPTPAVGGVPRAQAMRVIETLEQFPRGWFAAPVGWIDHQLNGQFVVAIRSAVSQGQRVQIYAGAGIVQESIPRKEWDETTLKFRSMLQALGLQYE